MEINNTQPASVEEESTSESSTTQLSSEKNQEIFELEVEALRAKLDKKSLEEMKKWEDLMENLIDDDSSWLNPQDIEWPSKDNKNWEELLESEEFWDGLDSIEKKILDLFEITLSSNGGLSDIQLTIKNKSPDCYKLLQNHLMLDGETERDNFVVIEKVTGNKLAYQGISAKSHPTYIKLESGQSMTSKQIHLDNIYNLEHNTAYEVYYMSTLTYIPCERSVEVSGFIESNHIDVLN